MTIAMRIAATTPTTDRLIWLSLLAVMAAALVTDQARANLHAEARAAVASSAFIERPLDAAVLCRMHLDVLAGEDAIGFGLGLREMSSIRSIRPPVLPGAGQTAAPGARPRHDDASR